MDEPIEFAGCFRPLAQGIKETLAKGSYSKTVRENLQRKANQANTSIETTFQRLHDDAAQHKDFQKQIDVSRDNARAVFSDLGILIEIARGMKKEQRQKMWNSLLVRLESFFVSSLLFFSLMLEKLTWMEMELSSSQEVQHGLVRENKRLLVENQQLKRELHELASADLQRAKDVEVGEWQQKLIEFESTTEETAKPFESVSVLEDLVGKLEESGCPPPLFITWDVDGEFEYYHIEWSNSAILVGTAPSTTTGVFTSNHKTSAGLSFEQLVAEAKQENK